MKLLITGGCGFIGVNLVRFILRNHPEMEIRVLDNLSVGSRDSLAQVCEFDEVSLAKSVQTHDRRRVVLIVGDIRDREVCVKATKGVDAVVHLAAHTGVVPSVKDPFHDFEVNCVGTLNLLNACVQNKVQRFIFASSNAPVGQHPPPMHEGLAPRPISPYGASKLACEGYCSAFYACYGLKTMSLRFSNAYGIYSLHKNSVVAKFIKDGLLKRRLTIYGDGTQTRDFLHAEDICRAVVSVLPTDEQKSSDVWGRVFHLGTGVETSINDLAKIVQTLFQSELQIEFKPERKGEIRRNYSDISNARRFLGFEPKVELCEGVSEVFKWFSGLGEQAILAQKSFSDSD
jgi:UDP-glucose 4-epimerase